MNFIEIVGFLTEQLANKERHKEYYLELLKSLFQNLSDDRSPTIGEFFSISDIALEDDFIRKAMVMLEANAYSELEKLPNNSIEESVMRLQGRFSNSEEDLGESLKKTEPSTRSETRGMTESSESSTQIPTQGSQENKIKSRFNLHKVPESLIASLEDEDNDEEIIAKLASMGHKVLVLTIEDSKDVFLALESGVPVYTQDLPNVSFELKGKNAVRLCEGPTQYPITRFKVNKEYFAKEGSVLFAGDSKISVLSKTPEFTLINIEGPGGIQQHRLGTLELFKIGRDPKMNNTIVIEDSKLSKSHMSIQPKESNISVKDNNSKTGVWVQIHTIHTLSHSLPSPPIQLTTQTNLKIGGLSVKISFPSNNKK